LTNESTKIKLVKLCSSIYCLTKMIKIAWFWEAYVKGILALKSINW
jgi:hypothetical protein